jgi:hypothetical protein
MFATKFVATSLGVALGVAVAVAIARPSSEVEKSRLLGVQSSSATCPSIEWPYGCKWRPASTSAAKHVSIRKSKTGHLSLRQLYELFYR